MGKKLQEYLAHLDFRFFLIPFVVFGIILAGVVTAQQLGIFQENKVFPKGVRYVADQILIRYKDGQSPVELEKLGKKDERATLLKSLSKIGVVSSQKLFQNENPSLKNYYLLTLQKGSSIPAVYEQLKNIPQIENATPDYVLKIQETPNDPYFSQMWNLQRIGMTRAWDISHTNNVTAAVVDTGVDYNHPDLAGVVSKGKNFISGDMDPMDDQGHGTHVAGIIAGVTNNGIGISGISWGAKILAVKACDKDGNCNTTNVSRAIVYAVDNGAKIINISIAGSGTCNGTYADTISYAARHGVLLISAAGNGNNGDGVGVDVKTQIPASCDGVLAVGSINAEGARSTFSNYGNKVEIAAPGGQGPCSIPTCILSTGLNNGYTLRAGTSMAAPQVSGAAALLLSYNSKLDASKVKSCLIRGGDTLSVDHPIGTLLNPAQALQLCTTPSVKETPSPTPSEKDLASSISGTVFVDKNGDQRFNTGEKVLSGAQVVLSGLKSDSAITNSKGRYTFPNLILGLYTISLTVQGQSIGDPIDVTLSPSFSSVKLDLPVSPLLITPTPTPTPQKTSSGCFIDPNCSSRKGTFQICSFFCRR